MARLIDADITEKILLERYKALAEEYGHYDHYTTGYGDALDVVEQAPTVDAVPVVHGRWCWQGKFRACSKCGSYVEFTETLGASFWKFCPFCGAIMDLEV